MKNCKICGKEFKAKGRSLTCSPKCSKINKAHITQDWQQSNPDLHKLHCQNWKINNRLEYNAQQRKYGKLYRARKRQESLDRWDYKFIKKYLRSTKND